MNENLNNSDGLNVPLSSTDLESNQEILNNLFKEVLHKIASQIDSKDIDSEIAINAMVATCTEFMKSFIILGYDLDGNCIPPIFYANDSQEADALTYCLHRYFIANR